MPRLVRFARASRADHSEFAPSLDNAPNSDDGKKTREGQEECSVARRGLVDRPPDRDGGETEEDDCSQDAAPKGSSLRPRWVAANAHGRIMRQVATFRPSALAAQRARSCEGRGVQTQCPRVMAKPVAGKGVSR